jgi:hypothetical protein
LFRILLFIFNYLGMAKTKKSLASPPVTRKRGGRQTGAKTYNKPTLLKLITKIKPTNSITWGIVAEHYRVQCGELEARSPAVLKKFFVQKMCNNNRKPTGDSGTDSITLKSQELYLKLLRSEESDNIEDDEDPIFDDGFKTTSAVLCIKSVWIYPIKSWK